MNADDNGRGLKTPDVPYPKSHTPPPTYEEATRNDHCYQPQLWLPSTSGGYTTGGGVSPPPHAMFVVEHQYNVAVSSSNVYPVARSSATTVTAAAQKPTVAAKDVETPKTTTIQNIPSVTITLDNDPLEI